MKDNFRYYWENAKRVETSKEAADSSIVLEVPGYDKDEIKVQIFGNTMTISANKKSHEIKKGKNYYREQAYSSSFSKSLSLPAKIDPRDLDVIVSDGVVTIKKKKKKTREIN